MENILGSLEGARKAALVSLVTTSPVHPFVHSFVHLISHSFREDFCSPVCSQRQDREETSPCPPPRPIAPRRGQGQVFLWEVRARDAKSWLFSQIVYLFTHRPASHQGWGFPGERPGLPAAACLGPGHRMGVCQYFNNWSSWTSWYKPHGDPPASGIHLRHAVWCCLPLQSRRPASSVGAPPRRAASVPLPSLTALQDLA